MTVQVLCKDCQKPITSNGIEQMAAKCSECMIKSALETPVVWYFCPNCNHRIGEADGLGVCSVCGKIFDEEINGQMTRTVEFTERKPTDEELREDKESEEKFAVYVEHVKNMM